MISTKLSSDVYRAVSWLTCLMRPNARVSYSTSRSFDGYGYICVRYLGSTSQARNMWRRPFRARRWYGGLLRLRSQKWATLLPRQSIAIDSLYSDVCVSAALASVKDAIGSFSWKNRSKDTVDPNGTTDEVAPVMNRRITMAHFTHALSEVPPSFSEDASEELYQWDDMYSNGNLMPRGGNGGRSNGRGNEKVQFETEESAAHLKLPSFMDMMAQFQKWWNYLELYLYSPDQLGDVLLNYL